MDDLIEQAEPRVIASLLIAVVLLAATAQVLYLLWPQIKEFRQLSQSHQLLNQAAQSNLGLEQQLKTTQAEIDNLSHQLHGDMAGLPDNQMESYIIGRLQKISWQTDVELASVIPGQGKRVQLFQETLFDVTIHGQYFNFFKWLQMINNDLGYIVVKKFDIRPQGGRGKSEPELAITLTLVSYRMADHEL